MDTRCRKSGVRLKSKPMVTLRVVRSARKSNRKCQSVLERERREMWKNKVKMSQSVAGLKVVHLEDKGRGVVSSNYIPKGTFICEYSGQLLTNEEALKQEQEYEHNHNIGCYMYYFMYKGEKYCIDATKEDGSFGRLINHSRTNPNIKSQTIDVDSIPHLIFYAIKDIKPGEELSYDYGDRTATSLRSHPWLKL